MTSTASVIKQVATTAGFQKLSAFQAISLEAMLEKKDVFVVAPTGTGKSLCYHLLPPVLRAMGVVHPLVVVFSPIVWLIDDQMDRLQKLGEKAVRADTWIPGDDSTFLFLRPEELTTTTLAKLQRVYLSRTWLTFVVDEAHCALNWGDSFREDYGQLKRKLALFKEAPKMALTATASPTTVEKIIGYLGLVDPEVVIEPASKQHIYLTVQPLETKMQVLEGLLEELKKDRGRSVKTVVFIRERTEVSNVWAFFHHYLPANISHRCEMYMSTTADRMKRGIAEYFKDQDSSIRLLIATSAFGLGVDCQGIRRVVHLEPPTSFDDFVQQIGRAGRNGEQIASILVNDGVQKGKDEQMRKFLSTKGCRRLVISQHYGLLQTACCDTCCDNFSAAMAID